VKRALDFLNANSGAFNLLFSFVVAAATVVYARLTHHLVSKTRRMRKAQTDPELVVRIQPNETWINLIEFVVENNGAGAALDVRLTAVPDFEYEKGKRLSEFGIFKHGIRMLAPRQSVKTFLMSVVGETDEIKNLESRFQFKVTAQYKTPGGDEATRHFQIDLLHLIGLVQLGQPPLLSIAKSIEAMEKTVASVISNTKRLHVVALTRDDVKKEREEQLARFPSAERKAEGEG
jgi:hypothetical protein